MFEPERVDDPLTTCVGHENPNALIVISGMWQVPCFGCMVAPCVPRIWFNVDSNFCAKGCHGGMHQRRTNLCAPCVPRVEDFDNTDGAC